MKSKPQGPKKTFESERKIQQRVERLRMIDRKLDNKKPGRGAKGQGSSGSSFTDRGGDRKRGGPSGARGGQGARGGRGARATRR
jgi:hypothetical protein